MQDGFNAALAWFDRQGRSPFPFQLEVWQAWKQGESGLLNAPTGSGKTLALFMPFVIDYINQKEPASGLKLLWITPLRALTIDIARAMEEVVAQMGLKIRVRMRTGDSTASQRRELKLNAPDVLLTTPESLHIMLSQKGYPAVFSSLEGIVVDEWHELLGSKRGVQTELALSRIKAARGKAGQRPFRIWGVSATIGNLIQARDALLGVQDDLNTGSPSARLVKADVIKLTDVFSIIPGCVEEYSWTGHLGVQLLDQVMAEVERSKTTLLFTNTRGQAEIWYHAILNSYPDYAGILAMHHGSISGELRNWVEGALHEGRLKLVVCTSSLDLGVDFRPVDTVIQVGSPKGIARFMQRAGRSGHNPGAISRIFFVPTHSLELMEGAALKMAMKESIVENREPVMLAFDVLVQYMLTLALSEGFAEADLYEEVTQTYSFHTVTRREFRELVNFLLRGGGALNGYDEYHKVELVEGLYRAVSKRVAMQHRLSMGTIVSVSSIKVSLNGKLVGTVEESFVSKMKPGDQFWFAGRSLELIRLKDMTAMVKKGNGKKGRIPSWDGGRMPLSSQLSALLRIMVAQAASGMYIEEEMKALKPVLFIQQAASALPGEDELLIEKFESKEGFHLFFYPFEGRLVHEGLGSLVALRLGKHHKASFSIAMNDYGFELLMDRDVQTDELHDAALFSGEGLLEDIRLSLNANEMARRKFRDIAHIAGLVFTGPPGRPIKNRHLQASTSLLFDVFNEYEPENFLVRQAYQEALEFQLEEVRLRAALKRMSGQKLVIKITERPTPFAFPILVDSIREKLTTETLEERVKKMIKDYSAK